MTSNKLSLLGIAFKAGAVLAGTAACENGIKERKIKLLILNSAISEGSAKHFRNLCEASNIDIITTDQPIGDAIGRGYIMIIGITDEGFKKAILKG